ncbi:DUF4910 domain-containing protein [soil metagenome]
MGVIVSEQYAPVERHASQGSRMYSLMAELYPICRSITGRGVEKTLSIIQKYIPLLIHKIPSGTKVFDWEIPKEWNIVDAYVKNMKGEKVIDFSHSNLHLVSYSIPIHRKVTLQELKEHLHTLPDHPDWIPYRTSYYKEDWGFCIAYNEFALLTDDYYEVCIESSLEPGHLTYGEFLIEGESTDEVLITTHICHPSLCNDNLSGICVASFLAQELSKNKKRYSYRFLFIPGTIGAITWLSINELATKKIKHGLVAALLGDDSDFTYKKSSQGNAEIDLIVEEALRSTLGQYTLVKYSPYGYDERQFCSPGFNLPVGCLSRTPYYKYPEYHTSADNLDLVKPKTLEGSLDIFLLVIKLLEANKRYVNTNPKCEPNLGKRGLYSLVGNDKSNHDYQLALLWILNLSDGIRSLLDISRESGVDFQSICLGADKLEKSGLLIDVQLSSP